MEGTAFVSLATLPLPPGSRLLPAACCPDKDLVAIVSRVSNKDTISLWKMQGSKKWEVAVDPSASEDEIVDLAWSPDGQTIAVAHNTPRITLHSVQDGHEERSLSFSTQLTSAILPLGLKNLWWFRTEKKSNYTSIPDIFRRNNVITGSSQSVLKILPLLDPLKDDVHPLTATDLFAFQGSQSRPTRQSTLPKVISSWPTLPSDLLSASIQSPSHGGAKQPAPGEELDEEDDINLDSILVASDDSGRIHPFLDGSYPLGSVPIGADKVASLSRVDSSPIFHAHLCQKSPNSTLTSVRPNVVQMPMLQTRVTRDVAQASSNARELVSYAMTVVKEMYDAWFGSDTQSGARELGAKWIRTLETKQREQFGQKEPNAMLDLTCLLVTGRASESLTDFLGSGEQMSERGIQKWESTVVEALTKLRDYSEKRLAPACQRLHLILEEVQGWSRLPQNYGFCEFQTSELVVCLELLGRAIVLSAWLAATARREFFRFREFIAWLRYETGRINPNPESQTQHNPRHDILEVNSYLMTGLVVSPIDRWFMGAVPQFSPTDLGIPGAIPDLSELIQRAQGAVKDHAQMAWQNSIKTRDLSHLDRNLDALVQDLAVRCQRVFVRASSATARSAFVSSGSGYSRAPIAESPNGTYFNTPVHARERMVRCDLTSGFQQYLTMWVPGPLDHNCLCMIQLRYGEAVATLPLQILAAVVACRIDVPEGTEDEQNGYFDVLDLQFFDDELIVMVYRLRSTGGTFIATMCYNDLGYENLKPGGYVNGPAREDLLGEAMELWKQNQPILPARSNSPEDCSSAMPKSIPTQSPPNSSYNKSASDDAAPRMSDVALRKKKNADAQAAFRARRANYIATLEETVTSLESVVLQLQDSCREARSEAADLRQENNRLRHEAREREKFWRALCQAKRPGQGPDHLDDLPSLPSSSFSSPYAQPTTMAQQMGSSHMNQFGDESLRYPSNDDPTTSMNNGPYHASPARSYPDQTASLPFAVPEGEHLANGARSQHLDANGMSKYGTYQAYGMPGPARPGWPQPVSQTSSSGGDSCPQDSGSSTHSPAYVESPHMTSPALSYVPRFSAVEDQKVPLSNLESAPYMFPTSPSLSPTTTPPSSSSTSLAPSFQFTFPDGSLPHDRPEYDYRRQPGAHGAEVTLHGGTADISLATASNGVRYRLGQRRANSGGERQLAAPLPQMPNTPIDPRRDRGSSEGDEDAYSRLRPRRSGTASRTSRSPSPGTPPISGTLAVIKAQAFGALRRTRARTKKSSETAAKVAMEVLEARGIGMGINVATGSKRQRVHSDDEDM
ncbi:hypothetical protein JAAARDRAFT_203134 [Jaapia argillacea MUCL 33604]|uniref:Anaphase-promoting complex subunit 4 n=1 Tax=Jaapia argillacea MUCL 33604 TaxID=933084 RepID=A0A067QM67_9AGAM|nr:hypothetical protein JAAARDRAFT_203134 [Jaapia argillacea MUCL 33604]